MRISARLAEGFRKLFSEIDSGGKVFLFGSRVDDERRGGDIDLFFEPSRPISLRGSLALENRIATLCDEKVDLLIKNPDQPEQPIHQIARRGVPL